MKFYIFITLSFLIIACKKDNTDGSKKTALSQHGWILKSIAIDPPYDYNGDGVADAEIMAVSPECERDNIYFFKTDKNIQMDNNNTKCLSTDLTEYFWGKWSFNADETELKMTQTNFVGIKNTSVNIRLTEFTDYSFTGTYRFNFLNNPLTTYTTTITYQKQP